MEHLFDKFMNAITDIIKSFLQPIKSQQRVRKLTNQTEAKDNQISDLSDERDEYKHRYYSARDMLASSILERLQLDQRVTDVRFGMQTENSESGETKKSSALVHCYVDSKDFDELKMFTASGFDNVDALIRLYEDLKNANITELINAELKSNAETDEAE